MSIKSIDGKLLKNMIIAGANNLEKNKAFIDSLNVFPVPDGDTGTNMSSTMMAAAKEVQKVDSANIYDVAKVLASGSLRGARGNSGVILSQIFRGFASGLVNQQKADISVVAGAFKSAVDTAYKAVMKPKEGTILSVLKGCAEKAEELKSKSKDIENFLQEILNKGNEVLKQTQNMLPVLKQAGVVDAGGQGLMCIFEGAFSAITSKENTIIKLENDNKNDSNQSPFNTIKTEDIKYTYCTEILINRNINIEKTLEIRNYLEKIGDSIVVVEDDSLIKIHVHTNNPGKVLEKGLEYGVLINVKIENMKEQHTNKLIENITTDINKNVTEPLKPVGFVSISMGDGFKQILKDLGVDSIVEGGQTLNPSTEDILEAVQKVNAEKVILLPNNKNIILAAEQVKELSKDKEIIIIPTVNITEGIAALIYFDVNADLDKNLKKMKDSIKKVKTGQLTYAVRDTIIDNKKIYKDDILGIIDEKIKVISPKIADGAKELIDKLIKKDSELITVYYGKEVKKEETEDIEKYLTEKYPDCEVEIHFGGQPLYYYIFSVE